jgi:ectoine hydroxylase-related dioxygenase (phytanoyl-CoA dioxygenase family)
MVEMFRSARLQRDFEADGFVTIPVLDEHELAAVNRHRSVVAGERAGRSAHAGLYLSLVDEEDVARRRTTIEEIHRMVGDELLRAFHPSRLLMGMYLIKAPGAPHTAPHQDPTMTDATAGDHVSLTAWIALQDVTLEAGALGIIRGSHQFSARAIGTPIPTFRTLSQGHEAMLFRYLTFVPVKAGEAVVFDTRCIHGALPNVTPDPRAVVAVRITRTEAPLYQFFLKPGTTDRLLKLRVTEDYLVCHRPQELYQLYQQGSLPGHCQVEDELQDDFTPLQGHDLEALCRRHGARDNGIAIDAAGAA